jgi:uncharacterized membrane protein YsdA (DUF1294 family)/cold shock CspA family protein
MKGTVVKFDTTRKFGFIRTSGDGDDIFFHWNEIISGAERLAVGCTVTFDTASSEKGPKAVKISVSKSAPVSPFKFFTGSVIGLAIITYAICIIYGGLTPLPSYLLAINFALFTLCGFDKSSADSTATRVPEKVLYAFAALGGSLGLILAMYLFRHKTQKPSFQLAVGVIIIAQIIGLKYLLQFFKGL